ncbi:putative NADPH-dependent methylglyoxal reductase [Echria macrotheca]|uniref:NADPH-dependent methylglyoxal reductase n=1 Tax=Echria macrotheca TaxID=438768 RepID=A0AAJ0F970_9PEZI|nr:putative NADPH-dependent methylglyoxal reductase [Echria macrotheca]
MPAVKQETENPGGKVLLTGGTGFIASHVLDSLLEHGFETVVTVRSEDKGKRLVDAVDPKAKHLVRFAIVGDIAQDGAFDEVMKSEPFDYVVHTASPYQLHWDDPVRDCLDPAIKGTTGILKSTKAYNPSVKRVVITSSSAAVLNPPNHRPVYDETSWCEITWEQAMDPKHTYRASKKFAEKAAWDFVSTQSPNFTLSVINNTYTFGPVQKSLAHPDQINTSNHRIRDLVLGMQRAAVASTLPPFTFVDVRDVALAHVRAMMLPEAGGERFYLVSGYYSNPRLAEIIRANFPELQKKLPPPGAEDDFPEGHWAFDTSKSRRVLGLEYIGLEKSVVDTVKSILEREDWGVLKA